MEIIKEISVLEDKKLILYLNGMTVVLLQHPEATHMEDTETGVTYYKKML